MINELNQRSRDTLRQIIDAYIETGEPVGSRSLSMEMGLSPATIRNVMAELEGAGLLFSPHVSAGRLPTEAGMRVFIEGMLEINQLDQAEKDRIESHCMTAGQDPKTVLEHAGSVLSGLSSCAGIVISPKTDRPLKQVDFVLLNPGRVLAVLVGQNGMIENRILDVPLDMPQSALVSAANYLNSRILGRTLTDAQKIIREEMAARQTALDELSEKLVENGIANYADIGGGHIIVKGQANLLENITALEDLEKIRGLFEALETRETMLKLLDEVGQGEGVQIFIGSENNLFDHSGCSLLISPYKNANSDIIGAIGVIGPTRINYGRIIPVVNYTSEVIGKLLG